MTMIDAKELFKEWEKKIKKDASELHERPMMNIIRVGNRPDTELYVNNKLAKAKRLGIEVCCIQLEDTTPQEDLNGILNVMTKPTILQLPLPKHLDHKEALRYLKPEYDVDGLTVTQKGMLVDGDPKAMVPATVKGIVKLIESVTSIEGKKVAILSRSELVGRPLAEIVLQKNGYPVVMHTHICDFIKMDEMRDSDIIVTACGKRGIFTPSYFRRHGQVIIDCSMYKEDGVDGVGDLDLLKMELKTEHKIASGYGYTGPATVLGLMENVVNYYILKGRDINKK